MKSSSIIAIIVAIIVILGGWYAYATYYSSPATPSTNTSINNGQNGADYYPNGNPAGTQETGTASSSSSDTAGLGADVNAGVTTGTGASASKASITLTANGFSPKTVTIKKGGTVTWTNTGSGQMWIGSDEHPTHTEYDGTSRTAHCASNYTGAKPFDECAVGNSYSFTFTKVGSFDYHNHMNPAQTGMVVVTE
jgi:plastocyanin